MEKIITIDGKKVGFRASALTVVRYNAMCKGRNMLQDFSDMMREIKNAEKEGAEVPSNIMPVAYNMGYVMHKQYLERHNIHEDLPKTAFEWVDSFEVFDLKGFLDATIKLWVNSNAASATSKNTNGRR